MPFLEQVTNCRICSRPHRVFLQEHGKACGQACCAMVIHRKQKIEPAEHQLTGAISMIECPPEKRTDANIAVFHASTPDRMQKLLLAYGISSEIKNHVGDARAMKTIVRAATAANPVVASVGWEGQGDGHWVLIEGRTKGARGWSSDYCISDPLWGLQSTSLTPDELKLFEDRAKPKTAGLLYNPRNLAFRSGVPPRKGILTGKFVVIRTTG